MGHKRHRWFAGYKGAQEESKVVIMIIRDMRSEITKDHNFTIAFYMSQQMNSFSP